MSCGWVCPHWGTPQPPWPLHGRSGKLQLQFGTCRHRGRCLVRWNEMPKYHREQGLEGGPCSICKCASCAWRRDTVLLLGMLERGFVWPIWTRFGKSTTALHCTVLKLQEEVATHPGPVTVSYGMMILKEEAPWEIFRGTFHDLQGVSILPWLPLIQPIPCSPGQDLVSAWEGIVGQVTHSLSDSARNFRTSTAEIQRPQLQWEWWRSSTWAICCNCWRAAPITVQAL